MANQKPGQPNSLDSNSAVGHQLRTVFLISCISIKELGEVKHKPCIFEKHPELQA